MINPIEKGIGICFFFQLLVSELLLDLSRPHSIKLVLVYWKNSIYHYFFYLGIGKFDLSAIGIDYQVLDFPIPIVL